MPATTRIGKGHAQSRVTRIARGPGPGIGKGLDLGIGGAAIEIGKDPDLEIERGPGLETGAGPDQEIEGGLGQGTAGGPGQEIEDPAGTGNAQGLGIERDQNQKKEMTERKDQEANHLKNHVRKSPTGTGTKLRQAMSTPHPWNTKQCRSVVIPAVF